MKLTHLKCRIGRFPHGPSGMTLVEVVVALAITGLAVGGIVNGYIYCTSSAQKAALALAANARAMERLEEIRSAVWDTTAGTDQIITSNFPVRSVILDMSGSGTNNPIMATIRTEISQISVVPPLKRIHVDCVWRYKSRTMTNAVETCRGPD